MSEVKKVIEGLSELLKVTCEKLEDYESIGTLEECREAMEKQKAKKPKYEFVENSGLVKAVTGNESKTIIRCPSCENEIESGQRVCDKCGQLIDIDV